MYQLYRCYGEDNKLLYVGVTVSILSRLISHSVDKLWFLEIKNITIEKYETKVEVLNAERQAIKEEHPLFNIIHNNENPIKKHVPKLIDKKETSSPQKPLFKPLAAIEGLVLRHVLANEIQVSEQTIALWEKKGLPVLRLGDQRLYDIKKVAEWIRKIGKQTAA